MFGWTTAGLALSVVCSSIGDLVVLWNDFHVVLCIVVHIKFIGLKIEGRFKDNEGTSQKSQNIQHTSRSVFLPMPNCSCSGPIKAQAKLEEGLLAVLPASLHHLHRKRAKLRGWVTMVCPKMVCRPKVEPGFSLALLSFTTSRCWEGDS
ncbi:unnamed protein product [Musa hybrid cultivar]